MCTVAITKKSLVYYQEIIVSITRKIAMARLLASIYNRGSHVSLRERVYAETSRSEVQHNV